MTTFATAPEAKEFFVSRIVAAARRENIPLSDLERQNLYFTELGSDAKPEYLEQAEELDRQCSMREYETKIDDLLKKAYDYDLAHPDELHSEDARSVYRGAYEVLTKEDHYILVMIDQTLGGKVKK